LDAKTEQIMQAANRSGLDGEWVASRLENQALHDAGIKIHGGARLRMDASGQTTVDDRALVSNRKSASRL